MRTPCDTAIGNTTGEISCRDEAKPWILAGTILASSMAFIDGTVVNVALPALQAELHATVVDLQWVVESYGLLLAALILTGGSLGDRFGRRLIFMSGIALFAASSVVCGMAANIEVLIMARSVQGFGGALLVPGSLAIISTCFDHESRGRAIGAWSGFTSITTALGPVLGGWLVGHASWRWVFLINVPIAAAALTITIWRIPESRSEHQHRMDWFGAILATLGLGCIVTGLVESSNLHWTHPLVLGSLIAGFGCLIAFVLVEARIIAPMVPLALFKNRKFSGANLLTLVLYAAIGIFFFLFPLNLIQVQQYSSTETGAAILPFILLMFLLSRWSGGLVASFGARGPLIIGPLIAALGFVLFALPSVASDYWISFFPAILVLGLGMAVTVAPLTTVVMNSVGEELVGTASGINNAVSRVASVMAVAVLGIVMVYAFRIDLNHSLAKLVLPDPILRNIKSHENQLAGMHAPVILDAQTRVIIEELIRQAFVFGFRVVSLICAGLSLIAAGIAWATIPRKIDESASTKEVSKQMSSAQSAGSPQAIAKPGGISAPS
jgi:EmrB/QacA subfamily drug resistance transporter